MLASIEGSLRTPEELPDAVKSLNTQLGNDPNNPELLYRKASALAKADLWAKALSSVEKAIKRNSEDARFWVLKGVAERKLGFVHQAKTSYETALRVEPRTPLAHFNLGILYDLYLNQPREAVEHFESFQQLLATPDQKVELWLTEIKQRVAIQ